MRPGAALLALLLAAAAPGGARAEEPACAEAFATCFDPGNRLVLSAAAASDDGGALLGGGIYLRHIATTADTDVRWRLEHALAEVAFGSEGWRATVYRGRYMRHSHAGHLVLPLNPPKTIPLHSDLGVELTLGAAEAARGEDFLRLGVVRAAILADVLRAPDFSRRLSFAAVARWDVRVATSGGPAVTAHQVAPFTMGAAALHLESADGLTTFDLLVEGGERWSDAAGFQPLVSAEASLERVVMAVNDRPIAVVLAGGWDDDRGARGLVGVRLGLFARSR